LQFYNNLKVIQPLFTLLSICGLYALTHWTLKYITIVRAISFQDFPPMWSWSTSVTDRRTDERTDKW